MFLKISRRDCDAEVMEVVGFNSRYERVPVSLVSKVNDSCACRVIGLEMVEFVFLHRSRRDDGSMVMSSYIFPDAELESVEEVGVSEGMQRLDDALRERLSWELGPGFGNRFHAASKEESEV